MNVGTETWYMEMLMMLFSWVGVGPAVLVACGRTAATADAHPVMARRHFLTWL